MIRISLCARSLEIPGFRRARTFRRCRPRLVGRKSLGSGVYGIQSSDWLPGSRNWAGATPTMVIRAAVQRQGFAKNVGIPAKAALPQAGTQNGDAVLVRLVLIGSERSSQRRLHSQDLEDTGRNGGGFDSFRHLAYGQRRGLKAHGCHLIQRLDSGCEISDSPPPKAAIVQRLWIALLSHTKTRLPESLYGSARNRTALVTLKIAALAPIPKLRTRIATAVEPGLFKNVRRAYRKSCVSALISQQSAL